MDSYCRLWLCSGAGVGNSIYSTLGGCLPGDYLEISDGSSSQRYCGTSTPAPLTTTNTITVKLHLVDYDGSVAAFLATFTGVADVLTDVNTLIWSPEYPEKYPTNYIQVYNPQ